MNISLMIGGAAGQGVNTTEQLITTLLTQLGYHFHASKDYMSRVRGGFNFSQLTFSAHPIKYFDESADIFLAMTSESVQYAKEHLKHGGTLICDEKYAPEASEHFQIISFDYADILKTSENPKGISMIGLGALLKSLSLSEDHFNLITNKKWSESDMQKNLRTAHLAYESSKKIIALPPSNNRGYMPISGNHAVSLGAAAAGISFYAAYPMAPSTGVMNYLTRYEKSHEIVLEQVEDEIAAINAIIGASATGIRAMTSTSGGGFSLMAEALGLSAVSEVPLVVLDVQRPGPATGMATRTEQSDLNFLLNASQGEFPRFVISYRSIEDCFYQTFRAFNLADKYRVPVLLMSDQYLADSSATVPAFDTSTLTIDCNINWSPDEAYKHYTFDDILSERAIPGMNDTLIMNDSHEHDENGKVVESAMNRIQMNQRRMEKLIYMADEVQEPDFTGSANPTYVFLAWGSVCEAAKSAAALLSAKGYEVSSLSFGDLYPLPQRKLRQLHEKNVTFINVEGNYQGQLAQLIARETGIWIEDSILKYDGRQISPSYIVDAFEELISDEQ